MLPQHFCDNLKGLSCSLLLLFGTFSLLVLSVIVGLYTLYLSSLWPYLLVLSVCLIGLLSWLQLRSDKSEHRLEENGPSPPIISSIPTITDLLTARGSSAHCPPPPYSEASSYQVIKPAVTPADVDAAASSAGSIPPPSYDEAIRSSLTDTSKLGDENNPGSRTYANPEDMV